MLTEGSVFVKCCEADGGSASQVRRTCHDTTSWAGRCSGFPVVSGPLQRLGAWGYPCPCNTPARALLYYYVLSLPVRDVLQILCRRRSGNAARTVGKKKVDRGGVVRLLYKQIPVRPDILSVGFGTLLPIPAHAVRCCRSPFRSYKQYPGKEGDRDW